MAAFETLISACEECIAYVFIQTTLLSYLHYQHSKQNLHAHTRIPLIILTLNLDYFDG